MSSKRDESEGYQSKKLLLLHNKRKGNIAEIKKTINKLSDAINMNDDISKILHLDNSLDRYIDTILDLTSNIIKIETDEKTIEHDSSKGTDQDFRVIQIRKLVTNLKRH